MKSGGAQSVLNLLEVLMEAELAVSEFYGACADTWDEDKDFWLHLVGEEKKHAENIKKMGAIISRMPDQFTAGRPITPIAVKTFISDLKNKTECCKNGEIQREKILFIARDIEKSIIESKYAEIVKTDNLEYKTLMKSLVEETRVHLDMVNRKIEETK